MELKCAWCQKTLSKTSGNIDEQFPISHGICPDCAVTMLQELQTTAKGFLNNFKQPIMLVDNVNNVILTNEAAKQTCPVDLNFSDEQRCGNLIGCIHSDLPGGCGATVHCQGCVIRRAILFTDKTGKPCREIACNDEHFYQGKRIASMIITTEKLGNRILLKIDPIKEDDTGKNNKEPQS